MKTEANPYNGALPARDASELRDTLFRTLSDLRAGRITAQAAKAVADAVTKALFGKNRWEPHESHRHEDRVIKGCRFHASRGRRPG